MVQGSKQSAEGINVGGRFRQSSDVAATNQMATNVEASSFTQAIGSQKSGLQLGRYRAVGVTGVIALVFVALGWFVLSYLTH
jgi:hypothetical protein